MKDKKVIKNIIILLVVAIIGLVLYSVFVPSKDDTGATGSLTSILNTSILGQVSETDVTSANREILRVLGSVENISLDDDIFSNPVFDLLQDSRFSIPSPARIGRPNPFLPSGFDAIASAQTDISNIDAGNTVIENSGSFEGDATFSGFFDEFVQ